MRDAALLASGKTAGSFPEKCRAALPELCKLWTGHLDDNIPSVRADAAAALGDALQAYRQELLQQLLPLIRQASLFSQAGPENLESLFRAFVLRWHSRCGQLPSIARALGRTDRRRPEMCCHAVTSLCSAVPPMFLVVHQLKRTCVPGDHKLLTLTVSSHSPSQVYAHAVNPKYQNLCIDGERW